MSINKSDFQVTIPNTVANRLGMTEQRMKSEFEVYSMDNFNRFIIFEDEIFVFIFKNESNDIIISSNEEFNIILSSKDENKFIVDFLVDHT